MDIQTDEPQSGDAQSGYSNFDLSVPSEILNPCYSSFLVHSLLRLSK